MQIEKIIRSKRKTIGIEVLPGGKVIVRAPQHTSDKALFAVLEKRADWIRKAQRKMASVESSVQPRRFVEGELFWYLGKEYPLHLVSSSTKQLRFDPARGFFLSLAQQPQANKLFTAWYRKQTRKLVSGLIAQYSKSHGFKITGVRITSARTRWGSCSAKNSLNFTYRLCMAPLAAMEYVVVHELVHTRVKNHSHKFWAGVSEILPGWKQQRTWLNTHGRKLDI